MRFPSRWRSASLVLAVVLFVVVAVVDLFAARTAASDLFAAGAPAGHAASQDLVQASPSGAADQALLVAPAPAPAHRSSRAIIFALSGAGLAIAILLKFGYASTTCNANGVWDNASIWSNGVPSSSLSAIVSATGGIPFLPALTSASAKQVTGGGKVGIQPGGVNKLNLTEQPANCSITFVTADVIEHNSSGSDTPRGHG